MGIYGSLKTLLARLLFEDNDWVLQRRNDPTTGLYWISVGGGSFEWHIAGAIQFAYGPTYSPTQFFITFADAAGVNRFCWDNSDNLEVASIDSSGTIKAYAYQAMQPANNDFIIKLGDAAGARKISVLDSLNVEIASINSDGLLTFTDIPDDSIKIEHLDAIDAPADEEVLSYDSATQRGEWIPQTGGEGLTYFPQTSEYLICDFSACGSTTFNGYIESIAGDKKSLTYTVINGYENTMVHNPTYPNQLGKWVLHNVTNGNSCVMLDCVAASNTITFSTAFPADWVVGNHITPVSRTVEGVGSYNWYDMDLSDIPNMSDDVKIIKIHMSVRDTATAGGYRTFLHPWETYAAGKTLTFTTQNVNYLEVVIDVPITSKKMAVTWVASGAATWRTVMKILGYYA